MLDRIANTFLFVRNVTRVLLLGFLLWPGFIIKSSVVSPTLNRSYMGCTYFEHFKNRTKKSIFCVKNTVRMVFIHLPVLLPSTCLRKTDRAPCCY